MRTVQREEDKEINNLKNYSVFEYRNSDNIVTYWRENLILLNQLLGWQLSDCEFCYYHLMIKCAIT